jgi:two-component sensor histidine kinase
MPEKVDVNALITTIVQMLVSSAPGTHGTPDVMVDVDHVCLGSEQAVPLALIVNELISNTFVHGQSSQGQPLRARIQCRQQDSQIELVVTDNGGGFTDGKDWREHEGQGMSIVAQLAQVNLRGHLQINSRDGGVCAELRFEIAPHGAGPGARIPSALTIT